MGNEIVLAGFPCQLTHKQP